MDFVQLITAFGIGGILSAIVNWLKDRKKVGAETEKTDVDTKLAYLNTVIERLDAEAKRAQTERDQEAQRAIAERARLLADLAAEQERNASLRKRVRELEEEIDGVRRSARETQHKCDELASRLKALVDEAQEEKA
jgi:predicted RNase H-like nuclease (RuvC/YqgF family)